MNLLRKMLIAVMCFMVVAPLFGAAEKTESESSGRGLLTSDSIYDVKDFGALGTREQGSKETMAAMQKAIDTCASNGGGVVYVPGGEYVTGQLNLRSNVRFLVEAGATIYGSRDGNDWPRGRNGILYGENLINVTIEGRGIIDGQAEHIWQPYTEKRDNEIQYRIDALKKNKPEGMPFVRFTRPTYNIILLMDCKDIQVRGVTLRYAPIWNSLYVRCERLVVDGVSIFSSLVKGMCSDGIDLMGCYDARIANCTIETGDDCISLKSRDWSGAAVPVENITITNCRLTSSSSAVKIGDEIAGDVKHVVMDNCVIRNCHRAFAFMILDGGTVSDVIISNITIDCKRYDWFWWGQGDAFYFKVGKRDEDSTIGKFENMLIKDVVAHVKGSSIINGHPESPLTDIRFENVKLFMSEDPKAYFKEAIHGIQGRYFKDLTLKDVEIVWGGPSSEKWKSALYLEDVDGLILDGFVGRQAHLGSNEPAVTLKNVAEADIRLCRAAKGTGQFLRVEGEQSKDIRLFANDFSLAKTPYAANEKAITFSFGNAGCE